MSLPSCSFGKLASARDTRFRDVAVHWCPFFPQRALTSLERGVNVRRKKSFSIWTIRSKSSQALGSRKRGSYIFRWAEPDDLRAQGTRSSFYFNSSSVYM
jgi:1,2-phenylacetyl-CoA epoxidase PaaB subunit